MEARKPSISIDVMSGDKGPAPVITAAMLAANKFPNYDFILIGDAKSLDGVNKGMRENLSFEIVNSTVCMDEKVANLKEMMRNTDYSMTKAVSLVKDSTADAMVSFGNTAAFVAISVHQLDCIPGINRPVLAAKLPNPSGSPTLFLDAGAVTETSTQDLIRSAYMGSAYAEKAMQRVDPIIRLVSVGSEAGKGNKVVREADRLLSSENIGINYGGLIEPNEILSGQTNTDVAVIDGFAGNLVLKAYEGIFPFIKAFIDNGDDHIKEKADQAMPFLSEVKTFINPDNHNGAPFLGLNRVVIKGHGRSNAEAALKAIEAAVRAVEADYISYVSEMLQKSPILQNVSRT